MDQLPRNCQAFHPKDPAHGTLNYDLGALNEYQKKKLNSRKATERYENEIYLKRHPEIKGFLSILLRHVLQTQPSIRVHETIGEFFNRSRCEILMDLLEYRLRTGQTFDIQTGLTTWSDITGTDGLEISCRNEQC
ncbi:uncharacterized protein LOC105664346 [Megachile rotundata]|uniref:uncharacterized protein LOC105664346 n=1 Tax=Megachile rotundata TaxID=143995 RepID=UPI000614BE88|nr:PREDICTED: uncharacterized protein LOC105664346 [Megachile rotundata]XP_012154082.1 PREDICTED: uncharacterized protein LOC105664346 [Megachile rotundata]XP_012154084.1 PREDICTED: uncharacterized protein LOC105664346 [Megachile rotundata]